HQPAAYGSPGGRPSPGIRAPGLLSLSRSAGSIGRSVAPRALACPASARLAEGMAMMASSTATASFCSRPPSTEVCSFVAQCVSSGDEPMSSLSASALRSSLNSSGARNSGPHRAVCFQDRIEFLASPTGEAPCLRSVDFSQLLHAELDVAGRALRLRLGGGQTKKAYICILLQDATDVSVLQKGAWPLLTRAVMAPRQVGPSRSLPLGPSLVWTHT
ncbi:unnamed protein product, partial [Polarella glacialis]